MMLLSLESVVNASPNPDSRCGSGISTPETLTLLAGAVLTARESILRFSIDMED